MPQYNLIPGTNQLVYTQPGRSSQLFNQWGYNINQPRWRDYYNMLRGNQGLQFADSLAQLLTKIWPTGSHATGTPATTAALSVGKAASNSLALPMGNVPGSATYNPGSFFNTSKILNNSILTDEKSSNYWGNNQWSGGPDPITRLNAYHALLRYAEHMDQRDRYPRYFVQNNMLLPGQSFEVANDHFDSPEQASVPAVADNFFYAHKKWIIGAAIALAVLVVYLKMKK